MQLYCRMYRLLKCEVNRWVINNGFSGSCKVDWITSAKREWHIYLQLIDKFARVIYLLKSDRQTVIYYSTIHALELIYFDSNTQEAMKKWKSSSCIFQILPTFRHCTEESHNYCLVHDVVFADSVKMNEARWTKNLPGPLTYHFTNKRSWCLPTGKCTEP